MTKQKSIMIAVAGASILAAVQAQAQLDYSSGDLLLNFRNTANITGNDLEVNAGPISAIEAFSGTEVLAPSSLVSGVFGSALTVGTVGFSASGDDGSAPSDDTLFLSRAEASPGNPLSEGGYISAQASALTQGLVVTDIENIGAGGNAGTSVASGAATVTGATTGDSYQAQGEQNTATTGTINFGSHENVAVASKGGNIESIQGGGGAVYEALWEVPVSGTGSDTYLGYLTFDTDGEVDYTSAVSAVPEPSTYGALAASGLLVLALRRQFRSLIA
jgi:hypothetical protein